MGQPQPYMGLNGGFVDPSVGDNFCGDDRLPDFVLSCAAGLQGFEEGAELTSLGDRLR